MAGNSTSAGSGVLGWGLGITAAAVSLVAGLYMSGVLAPRTPPEPDKLAALPEIDASDPPQTAAAANDTAAPATPDSTPPAPEPTPELANAPPIPAPETPQSQPAADPDAAEPGSSPDADSLPAPVFDVVRVDPDGNTVIAGTATPGSRVVILMDDTEIEAPEAGADGGFVSLLTLPLSDAPRVLTLRAERGGQSALSDDQIIIAPTPRAAALPVPAAPTGDALPSADAAPATAQIATTSPETAPQTKDTAPETVAAPETAQPEPVKTADAADSTTPADPPASETQNQTPGVTIAREPRETETTAAPEPEPDPSPVTVLRAGADGVEILQPATGAGVPAAQVTLDTISYSTEGAVLLRGTARAGTIVRAYLDNQPVGDLNTNAKGRFRGEIGVVAPGLYTLRLDELDGAGQVLSRLETPFKREAPEVLQPPEDTPEDTKSPVRAVTVQTGDTLWAISRDRYGDGVLYVKVVQANRDSIKNPDLIYPGQVFTIPD